jgi:hypothetical protein
LLQLTKTGKTYQITLKYTKTPYNIPDGHKIDQMANNIPTSSITAHSKIYPNRYFWFENEPSGNPGADKKSAVTFRSSLQNERVVFTT